MREPRDYKLVDRTLLLGQMLLANQVIMMQKQLHLSHAVELLLHTLVWMVQRGLLHRGLLHSRILL